MLLAATSGGAGTVGRQGMLDYHRPDEADTLTEVSTDVSMKSFIAAAALHACTPPPEPSNPCENDSEDSPPVYPGISATVKDGHPLDGSDGRGTASSMAPRSSRAS